MKKSLILLAFVISSTITAAEHAGLDSTLKCVPGDQGFNLVKELSAVYVNKVNNVFNKYHEVGVSEKVIAEGIDLETCLGVISDAEAKKLDNN